MRSRILARLGVTSGVADAAASGNGAFMDQKLVAWARAVKSRQRFAPKSHRRGCFPVLWLFTDAARLPAPRAAVERLPIGLCGVVLRHDGAADRVALGRDLA